MSDYTNVWYSCSNAYTFFSFMTLSFTRMFLTISSCSFSFSKMRSLRCFCTILKRKVDYYLETLLTFFDFFRVFLSELSQLLSKHNFVILIIFESLNNLFWSFHLFNEFFVLNSIKYCLIQQLGLLDHFFFLLLVYRSDLWALFALFYFLLPLLCCYSW